LNSVKGIKFHEATVYRLGVKGCSYRRICWLAYACGIGTVIGAAECSPIGPAERSPIIDLTHSRTTDRTGWQVN